MNKKMTIAAIFAAMLVFTACDKDDNGTNQMTGLDSPVHIVASIEGQVQTRATFKDDGSGSFVNGDKFILRYVPVNTNTYTNLTYTVGQTLKWSDISDGSSLNLLAWFPDTAALADVPNNANAKYIPGGLDLLVAPRVSASPGETVNLQFAHAMHKLVIKLTSEIHTEAQLAAAKITLQPALKTHAYFEIVNGTVNIGAATTLESPAAPYPVETGDSISFIVAPQTLAANVPMVAITVGGKNYMFNVPSGFVNGGRTLSNGRMLTLNLKISAAEVALSNSDFSAWIDQGTHNGNPTETTP